LLPRHLVEYEDEFEHEIINAPISTAGGTEDTPTPGRGGHEKPPASLSALLNTAEGNGKRAGRQRAKAFDDARGSAIECAACLDAAAAKNIMSEERVRQGKPMLARIVAMLTRLVDLFDTDEFRVRKDPPAE
jgi:23S rRNA-intervening sequence protein